ncbi:sigma 54-interacting transcriptional regulator [Rhodococcus koreensis]
MLLESDDVSGLMVGRSQSLRAALRRVIEVARYSSSSLLITGESGTGKELVAGLVHRLDARQDKGPFVVVDCTTVTPSLSGSEFFGHEKGAFTGADAPREGAFALANKGTLFLDEVGELPLSLQAELLRVTQEGVYKKLGSNAWHRTRFRLITATHRDLVAAEAAGTFRRDLYYRIAAATVHLPPLAERTEAILMLFDHFLGELHPDREPTTIDSDVADVLQSRSYPGNVRDLRQLAHRVHVRHVGPGPITVGDLPEEERPEELGTPMHLTTDDLDMVVRRALNRGMGLSELRQATVETAVRVALEDSHGHVHTAAQLLGVSDRALQLRRAGARDAVSGPGDPASVGQLG